MMELERQQNVLVVCDQAISRCLLAYFLNYDTGSRHVLVVTSVIGRCRGSANCHVPTFSHYDITTATFGFSVTSLFSRVTPGIARSPEENVWINCNILSFHYICLCNFTFTQYSLYDFLLW